MESYIVTFEVEATFEGIELVKADSEEEAERLVYEEIEMNYDNYEEIKNPNIKVLRVKRELEEH